MAHSTSSLPASADPAILLSSQSPRGMQMERAPRCCCGRSECVYLEHNAAALEGLERDLQSAAQIGQVGARSSARESGR